MSKLYAWLSYISGNTPIALILLFNVGYDNIGYAVIGKWEEVHFPEIFLAAILVIITSFSSYFMIKYFNDSINRLKNGNGGEAATVSDLQVEKIFSSGAITYYILPFASFIVGDDIIKNLAALFILGVIFGQIYVKERMTIYSPILCLFGYVVFSCDRKFEKQKSKRRIKVLVKNPESIVTGNKCGLVIQSIDNTVYIATLKET